MTLLAIAQHLLLRRARVSRICLPPRFNLLSYLAPAPPVQRYERVRPGELLHLDVLILDRILLVGHRITGERIQTHLDVR